MSAARQPVFFISHGGGPWPWVDGMRQQFAKTERELIQLPKRLPTKPKAVVVVTGHWEAPEFTVATAAKPPMDYDYTGFPAHTYKLQYPAPGSAAVSARVDQLLTEAGFKTAHDDQQGFDHGTFVPMALMYPDADVPVVLLSMKSRYDAAEHIKVGQALQPLRDEGVLIMGSGLTYHNMRGFGRPESTKPATDFEAYLNTAITQPSEEKRNDMLVHWEQAPAARQVHPREDHLIPLMVVAGAAGEDVGERLFVDLALHIPMTSYRFGEVKPV
ncbi:class III extradiol ring-cleavage dioxygenase [soil metagenome]